MWKNWSSDPRFGQSCEHKKEAGRPWVLSTRTTGNHICFLSPHQETSQVKVWTSDPWRSSSGQKAVSPEAWQCEGGEKKWKLVSQLCPIPCNSMDSSPPGSSVHGILQARVLEWVAIPFSRGSSRPRDWTWVSCTAGRLFTIWAEIEDKCSGPVSCQWFSPLLQQGLCSALTVPPHGHLPRLMGCFHRPREQTVVSQSNVVGAEQMEIKIIVCRS